MFQFPAWTLLAGPQTCASRVALAFAKSMSACERGAPSTIGNRPTAATNFCVIWFKRLTNAAHWAGLRMGGATTRVGALTTGALPSVDDSHVRITWLTACVAIISACGPRT